jgi:hypothetical protein
MSSSIATADLVLRISRQCSSGPQGEAGAEHRAARRRLAKAQHRRAGAGAGVRAIGCSRDHNRDHGRRREAHDPVSGLGRSRGRRLPAPRAAGGRDPGGARVLARPGSVRGRAPARLGAAGSPPGAPQAPAHGGLLRERRRPRSGSGASCGSSRAGTSEGRGARRGRVRWPVLPAAGGPPAVRVAGLGPGDVRRGGALGAARHAEWLLCRSAGGGAGGPCGLRGRDERCRPARGNPRVRDGVRGGPRRVRIGRRGAPAGARRDPARRAGELRALADAGPPPTSWSWRRSRDRSVNRTPR